MRWLVHNKGIGRRGHTRRAARSVRNAGVKLPVSWNVFQNTDDALESACLNARHGRNVRPARIEHVRKNVAALLAESE